MHIYVVLQAMHVWCIIMYVCRDYSCCTTCDSHCDAGLVLLKQIKLKCVPMHVLCNYVATHAPRSWPPRAMAMCHTLHAIYGQPCLNNFNTSYEIKV